MRLGALIPFEQVGETLAEFTGVEIGVETARALTERAGEVLVQGQAAEAEQLRRECPAAPAGPEVQQVSVDGAMVPLVGGVWAEVKTLAVGTVERRKGAGGGEVAHTVGLSYFSRLCDAAEFAAAALPELHRRGIESAGEVCAVVDGAEWQQRFVDSYRLDAIRILDFPHAAEHLASAAQVAFGPGTAETSDWLGHWLHELKHGDPDRVLAAVRALPVRSEEARSVRDGVLSYLEKRRTQITYAKFQAAGYPIGSGIVESANKLVVEVRLKGSGMHWARENVNPMLSLRCALCSGRWDETWALIWDGLRQQQTQRRRLLRQLRTPPPQPTKPTKPSPPPPTSAFPTLPKPPPKGTMINGRPTANHPWSGTRLSHKYPTSPTSAKS